jgi:hypothetical protein
MLLRLNEVITRPTFFKKRKYLFAILFIPWQKLTNSRKKEGR